nr:proteinase inhibitor PSI-1.2-like [Ipomoea batatas]GME05723.1 proteinase inhibitor PSI-1.2-like [Ipomoea batatas]
MATSKVGFVTLLLCSIVFVLGCEVTHANGQVKACTLECNTRAKYIICPRESKAMQIGPRCENCCTAKSRGCMLYDTYGCPICKDEQSFCNTIN